MNSSSSTWLMALVVFSFGCQRKTELEPINKAPTTQTQNQTPNTTQQSTTQTQPTTSGETPTTTTSQPPISTTTEGVSTPPAVGAQTPVTSTVASVVGHPNDLKIEGIVLNRPADWNLHQEAEAAGVTIRGFARGNDYVRIYVKKQIGLSMQSIFVNGSQLAQAERAEASGDLSWKRLDARRGSVAIAAFLLEHQGSSYYGFARAPDSNTAATIAKQFISAIRVGAGG